MCVAGTRKVILVNFFLSIWAGAAPFVTGMVEAAGTGVESGIHIQTIVGTDSITVGERLRVRYVIDFPDSLELLPATGLDLGNCRLLSIHWKDEEGLDGRAQKTAKLELFTLDLEAADLPGPELRFFTPSGDTLSVFAENITVPVRALTATGADLSPLKDPWEAPADYRPYVFAGILAVIAAAAVFLWWKRRKRRTLPEVIKPEFPPDFIALKELTRIEGLNLLEQGEFKKYYTLVTDAVRRYIEGRFGIDAMDRTTSEVLLDFEKKRRNIDFLESLLQEADLVKFAKHIPGIPNGMEAMKMARNIVVRTKQPSISELTPQTAAGTSTEG